MTRTLRAGALTAVALALAFALAGCFGDSRRRPRRARCRPLPQPIRRPSAEPVDPLTTVTSIVPRPEALELRDDAGDVVTSLAYVSDPADAVEVLTAVFGATPVAESHPGSSHFPPTTEYRWDGLSLWEQLYDGWAYSEIETSLVHPRFSVRATAAESGGVELASSDGRHVGEAWSELDADPSVRTDPSGCTGPYVDYVMFEDGAGQLVPVSVEFRPTDDEAAIGGIAAPLPVYGACA